MISEIKHKYGEQVHILNDPYLTSMLTRLCHPETHQPTINQLVHFLYTDLIKVVLNKEFSLKKIKVPTRMTEKHPGHLLEADVLDQNQKTVTVNLARAGTFPSHICYNALNYILNPECVRQDHVIAARKVDENKKVLGTTLEGSKIGGDIEKAVVLFPDPMGATGSTLVSALDFYKSNVEGKPKKFIALHLIITPEYLKRISETHNDLVIYAVRIDRGLSKPEILKTVPGERWNEERGLDDTQYIVPGGGGFGEILNNSYV
jgi:uracil phosphoribosyltransferase